MNASGLQNEVEFFNTRAGEQPIAPLDPSIVRRYADPSGPWSIDFMFRLAGDVQGLDILDVGAGCGENSLVLAALGARVTALDISPCSLAVLRDRAKLSGLGNRIETLCCPIEEYRSARRYDLVWADSFLHHVIPSLTLVLNRLQAASPRMILSEPTAPAWVRRLRMALPVPTCATAGERPLLPAELRVISECLGGLNLRYFRCLSRLVRWLPERRARPLAYLDNVLLSARLAQPLASVVVMWR